MPKKKIFQKSMEALGDFLISLVANQCPKCKKWKTIFGFNSKEWSQCDACAWVEYWEEKWKEESKSEQKKQREAEIRAIESSSHGLHGGKYA